jgi:hypothetical protein
MDEFNAEEWKEKINNLIWTNFPGDTTLDQAEEVACRMFNAVENFYRMRKQPKDSRNIEEYDGYKERSGI